MYLKVTVFLIISLATAAKSVIYQRCLILPAFIGEVGVLLPSVQSFDNTISLPPKATFRGINGIIESIVPSSLRTVEGFCTDIKDLIVTVSSLASSEDKLIICRLALLDSERKCPQWHEDYVKVRLLKTYSGLGTEYCSPEDRLVRLSNFARSIFDIALSVDPGKVKQTYVNDALIISGRNRKGFIPVLHRSPMDDNRRLLLTISIS